MSNQRGKYLSVGVKGIAMGAADVVPGVSGGTIAFITGIYEELISSISNIDMEAARLLFKGSFSEMWKKINGNFLVSLVLGIGISIFSLARLMTWLLENRPVGTWSFFFGLIIASSILVAKSIQKWNAAAIISMIAGIAAAYMITVLTPASTPQTWWFIILSGALAICAMVLPGISGAFILLLLGKYAFIMDAVANLRIGTIALFAIGAVAGIISFSRLLSWLLKNYHSVTISLLTGFMIGSLNKVWPWKETLETYTDNHGNVLPLVERNVLPATYESITGSSSELPRSILLCAAGFLLIVGIEFIQKQVSGRRKSEA